MHPHVYNSLDLMTMKPMTSQVKINKRYGSDVIEISYNVFYNLVMGREWNAEYKPRFKSEIDRFLESL